MPLPCRKDSRRRGGHYYASIWNDAREVALYVEENYAVLRSRTIAFKEALFASTLPPYVLDADLRKSGNPQVSYRVAPGKWRPVGMGGMFS